MTAGPEPKAQMPVRFTATVDFDGEGASALRAAIIHTWSIDIGTRQRAERLIRFFGLSDVTDG